MSATANRRRHNMQQSPSREFDPIPFEKINSPEGRSHIEAANVIVAVDPAYETQTIVYGRSMVEEIVRSGTPRPAIVLPVGLDLATDELDRLDELVRAVKGQSSFRPADLFPEVVIHTASFASDPDLLGPVRLAV